MLTRLEFNSKGAVEPNSDAKKSPMIGPKGKGYLILTPIAGEILPSKLDFVRIACRQRAVRGQIIAVAK